MENCETDLGLENDLFDDTIIWFAVTYWHSHLEHFCKVYLSSHGFGRSALNIYPLLIWCWSDYALWTASYLVFGSIILFLLLLRGGKVSFCWLRDFDELHISISQDFSWTVFVKNCFLDLSLSILSFRWGSPTNDITVIKLPIEVINHFLRTLSLVKLFLNLDCLLYSFLILLVEIVGPLCITN